MRLKGFVTGLVVVSVAVVAAGYAILSNLDFEQLRDLAREQAREATGRELEIAGPIDLQVSLTPRIELNDISFSNAEWGSEPTMATVSRFELEVELLPLIFGEINVKRLIMVEPRILIETDAAGRGNWVFESAAAEDPDTTPDTAPDEAGAGRLPAVHLFVLENGFLIYRDGRSGESMTVALDRLAGEAESPREPLRISALGRIGDAPFKLQGSFGPLGALTGGGDLSLGLSVETGEAVLAVDGRITDLSGASQVELTLSAKGPSLAPLGGLAGVELPALGPFEVSARVEGGAGVYQLSGLGVKLGGSGLSGSIEATLTGARPEITGSLISRRLDLADLTAGEGTAAEPEGSASPYVFPPTPLPLDALGLVDATFDLRVREFALSPQVSLHDLEMKARLRGGELTVDPLAAVLAEGELQGGLTLDAREAPAGLALNLRGRNIDLGRLARETGVDSGLEGRVGLDLDVNGRGGSPRAIASTLSGSAAMASPGGRIDNQLFKVLAVGLDSITGPLLGSESQAALNCFVVQFDFEQGLGRSRALALDSETMILTGEGTLDLRSEALDLDFDTATRQPSLASLAVPFKVGGTLKNPKVSADAVGAATGAVENLAGTATTTAEGVWGYVAGLLGNESGSGGGGGDGSSPCVVAAAAPPAAPLSEGGAAPAAPEDASPATGSGDGSSPAESAPSPGGGDDKAGEEGDKGIDDAFDNFKRDLGRIGDLFD
jgi:uncharacterized protein involved in outer membrane biogenesis